MSEIIIGQMDYIYFVYGLAFVLLAAICDALRHNERTRLPWLWLGLFGLCHGIYEWLEMLTFILGEGTAVAAVRLSLLTVSFLFLLEFGRQGWQDLQGRSPGRWIHVVFLAGAAIGGFAGTAGLNVGVRYSLCLSGALWCAMTLGRASRELVPGRTALGFAAVTVAGYAIVAGVVVPVASFFPASAVNLESFVSFTGIPVQVARTILAVFISISLWVHLQQSRWGVPETERPPRVFQGLQVGLALAVVLIAGWSATEYVGEHGGTEVRDSVRNSAGLAATALDPGQVRSVTDTAADVGRAGRERLWKQLTRMRRSHPQFRALHLMLLGERGTALHAVDSGPHAEEAPAEPGAMACASPPPGVLDAVATGETLVEGPYDTELGTLLTGFAPVRDPVTGQTLAVVALDVDASRWQWEKSLHRLGPITVTFLVSVLLIGFFAARQRLWESSQRTAVSEHRLAEAQKLAHIGSWTYDPRDGRMAWSAEMFRILGYDPGCVVPSHAQYLERIRPDDRPTMDAAMQKVLREGEGFDLEVRVSGPDGVPRDVVSKAEPKRGSGGAIVQLAGTVLDITDRKRVETALKNTLAEKDRVLGDLQRAMAEVKTLQGLLSICANCKRIRDEKGKWTQIEIYVHERSNASFSHGVCPDCLEKLYPEFYKKSTAAARDAVARAGPAGADGEPTSASGTMPNVPDQGGASR